MGLYVTAFLSGGAIMLLEVLGFRLLPPYFGYSLHVWGALLGVVMVALSAGYYVGGVLADRRPRPQTLYLMVLVAATYCGLVLGTYPTVLRLLGRFELVTGTLLASLWLFAVPMGTLSTVSPFVIRLLAREGRVGGAAGRVYAVSTAGSIAGTLLTSFALIPAIGIRASFAVTCVVLALVAGLGLLTDALRGSEGKLDPVPP